MQNKAITLIALIITIIVLLILAGVTLNMVMGENGLFGKANNAKNKTEVAQYEEELRMCVLELQTDAATSGTTFNMETIKNKFEGKVKELENTTEIEFPTEESETRLDGTYKGYEFYIDDKFAAHIGDKATGISLTTSIEPSGWTQGPVTAIITIKSNNGINKVEPDEGSKNGNNEYIITKENIAENTNFEYTVTDGQGNTQTKTAVINTIDKNPPADFTITAENTEEGLRITGEATDAESGIDKYEYYAKKSTDSDYTKYDNNPITGLASGTYSVYVIAYDKAGNQKQSNIVESVKILAPIKRTDISATDIKENPEGYYGQTVDYTSENGQNDWKIFHSDGTNIYLITGNYVKVKDSEGNIDTGKLDPNTKMKISDLTANYRIMWDDSDLPSFSTDVSSEIISKFKINTNVFNINKKKNNTKYQNAQVVSALLDKNNWTKYIDKSKGLNQYAIGGPTVELWVESWNANHQELKIYCDSANSNGYYIGNASASNTTQVILSSNTNNEEELYFANEKGVEDGQYNVMDYLLASPSAYSIDSIIQVAINGRVIGNRRNYNMALRPVVCLTSNISLK